MFKLTSIIALTIICSLGFSYGQALPEPVSLQVTYELTYRPDSTKLTTKKELMLLWVGPHYSKFQSITLQKKDSILQKVTVGPINQQTLQNIINQASSLPKTRFRWRIFKTYNKNVRFIDEVGDKYYENSLAISFFKWKISTGDTKTINGYNCQKAELRFEGRTYEAWFTREIPISDGPYKFCGLPGLIIQIADKKQNYSFALKGLRDMRNAKVAMVPFKKGTIPASMKEIRVGQLNDLKVLQSGQAPSGIKLSPERIEEIRLQLKNDNNSIELY